MPASRRLAPLVATALIASCGTARPLPSARLRQHVAEIARVVGGHLPLPGPRPRVVVAERPAVSCGPGAEGELEISTGLLSALRSDAELALVMGYEQARHLLVADRRATGGVGRRAGRAATVGAAAGIAAREASRSLRGSSGTVRAAATGAAAAATAVLADEAWRRRGDRSARKRDDRAAGLAMGAVLSAGWSGERAQRAWGHLAAASPQGVDDGGLADRKANRQRRRATARVLRRSAPTVDAERTSGADDYGGEVLALLDGWRLAAVAGSAARADTWLTYDRSGGFTGWSLRVGVHADGRTEVSGTRFGESPAPRRPLTPEELTDLRRRVERALALPPRLADPQRRHLADGQVRHLAVREGATLDVIALSDDRILGPGDLDLVRLLEDLARR